MEESHGPDGFCVSEYIYRNYVHLYCVQCGAVSVHAKMAFRFYRFAFFKFGLLLRFVFYYFFKMR